MTSAPSKEQTPRRDEGESELLSRAEAASMGRAQLGMYVFLASDLMLFAPFFAAYYLLRTNAVVWPPATVSLDVPRAAAATLVLIGSSVSMLLADRAAEKGHLALARRWLLVTVALGATFLGNQIAEYTSLSFGPDDHPYGSIYWLLTGLHSTHVTIGLLALLALVTRTFRVADADHLSTWMAGVSAFWHLIDVVWIAVFLTIWVIR